MAASSTPVNNRPSQRADRGLESNVLVLEFSNRQSSLNVDILLWEQLLTSLLHVEGVTRGEVSVSIVHDHEIQVLNWEYLKHDYPTDVLSFVLDRQADELNGEIVVSSDTALARCLEFGWSAHDELTLYLIHGALHLVGYNDKTPEDCQQMRERERHYLSPLTRTAAAADRSVAQLPGRTPGA
jgi:probable rRNA maturation factor